MTHPITTLAEAVAALESDLEFALVQDDGLYYKDHHLTEVLNFLKRKQAEGTT